MTAGNNPTYILSRGQISKNCRARIKTEINSGHFSPSLKLKNFFYKCLFALTKKLLKLIRIISYIFRLKD